MKINFHVINTASQINYSYTIKLQLNCWMYPSLFKVNLPKCLVRSNLYTSTSYLNVESTDVTFCRHCRHTAGFSKIGITVQNLSLNLHFGKLGDNIKNISRKMCIKEQD